MQFLKIEGKDMTWSEFEYIIFYWWRFPICKQHIVYKTIWHYLYSLKPQLKLEYTIACPKRFKYDVAFQTCYSQSVGQETLETTLVDTVTYKV